MTSIAQPTSRRSPSQPGLAVRAWMRSPCASCRARRAWTGSEGITAGGGTSGRSRPSGRRNRSSPSGLSEGRLREQGQRVGLLLLVQRLARCGQRLHEQSPDLRRQPAPENDHTVLALIHIKRPALVPPGGLPILDLPPPTTPATNDPLHV